MYKINDLKNQQINRISDLVDSKLSPNICAEYLETILDLPEYLYSLHTGCLLDAINEKQAEECLIRETYLTSYEFYQDFRKLDLETQNVLLENLEGFISGDEMMSAVENTNYYA